MTSKALLWSLCGLLLCGTVAPRTPKGIAKPGHPVLYRPEQIPWFDGGKDFPGLKFAYIQGDASKSGPYTMRVKIPPHGMLPPHYHPSDESGTVISGTFYTGMGPKFDKTKAVELPAGGLGYVPKKSIHYAWVDIETVVQVHGQGPWCITFVNEQGKPVKTLCAPHRPTHRLRGR